MVNLGKFGSFLADALVDQPYGLTYESINKTINVIPPLAIEELEDTNATNELINDGNHQETN
jgi:tRNA (adenine-N(1)-)-methyltransferase non-catalytic subunit